MRYVNSKLAREVNRLSGWRGPVFDRRYEMTVVTDEDAAQIERLRYVLGQAVQANLVERVCQWPGVEGHWFDRTQEFAARLRREDIGRMRFATVESVTLSPIPCWAHLSPERYQERIAALVESIETDAARERERTGASVLGVKAISRTICNIAPPFSPDRRRRASTPPPRPHGRRSTRSTTPSSLRSAKPPKGCSAATATHPSPPEAFRRRFPSWPDNGNSSAL